jgi:transposase
MLADRLDFVIGVDSHRDAHALAVLKSPGGARLLEAEVAATPPGYGRALALAREHAAGARAWAIEGTGSYGKGLARYLGERGELVFELERPKRPRGRRERGKSDALDARRAARALLEGEQLARPRRGGAREALRCLLQTRDSAVQARRVALNQLRALVVTCPEPLRGELRSLTRARLLARCRRLRAGTTGDPELAGTLLSLRLLADRIAALTAEERLLARELRVLVEREAPALLAERGVGPITAAQLLVSWSHNGRFRSEACFARLGGAPPIPASSGQTLRHRLDRGGDRRLNRALHQIVVSRRKCDPRTAAYIARRTSEGKSEREAIRILKRYLARHLYRIMETAGRTA